MQHIDHNKTHIFFSRGWWQSRIVGIFNFFTHPITIFVGLQAICIAMAVIWVIWFVDQTEAIEQVNRTISQSEWDRTFSITMLVVGCVLLGMLIVGTIFLFVFAQRQSHLIRMQKNFVSSVTHELRSPLASLQLAFETLSTRRIPPEVEQHMYNMASRDIERLSRLVEQILLSARLDRGLHASDEFENFPFREVVLEAVERIDHLDNKKAHERLHIEGDEHTQIIAQKAVVRLIISNLIENAVKYSPPQTPILIRFNTEADKIRVEVRDQGFGLTKADRRKVFRMFHRASIATKKAIPGTGLGLYIVRTLIKNLGGKVWADSKGPGLGSSFFILLPLDTSTILRKSLTP